MITGIVKFSDWQKLELRVGRIIEVEEVSDADRLYKLIVDLGSEIGKRIVCAGIKPYYSKEELMNKKIVLFVNLEPRKIRGIESQGMILVAGSSNDDKVALLTIDKNVKIGSLIK